MKQHLAKVTILVSDYDEALDFYTTIMGFEVLEDSPLPPDKRWVVVSPKGGGGSALLLAKAASDAERMQIGNQAGGRVFLFLNTDDFYRDYQCMRQQGVQFLEQPRKEVYGTVAVFEDLYGNKWDLIEPA